MKPFLFTIATLLSWSAQAKDSFYCRSLSTPGNSAIHLNYDHYTATSLPSGPGVIHRVFGINRANGKMIFEHIELLQNAIVIDSADSIEIVNTIYKTKLISVDKVDGVIAERNLKTVSQLHGYNPPLFHVNETSVGCTNDESQLGKLKYHSRSYLKE